ncbi:hypothetical protein Tco_1465580 [Tanacetum coccineum]
MCVVNILNSVNATPTVKIVLNKGKQIWKPKGKLSDNRSTGKKVALGKLNCGYQWRPTGKKFALGELCPLTKLSVQCHPLYLDSSCHNIMTGNRSKLTELCGKVHRGQAICDSDLEVAIRKHTCFVRDINGANILKGSRSTNLYTISIDEMMKSSLICLLSKNPSPNHGCGIVV